MKHIIHKSIISSIILGIFLGHSPSLAEQNPDPYCTKVYPLKNVEISLYTPRMFRVRKSLLEGNPFPAQYEIPFVIGHRENWKPVSYTKSETGNTFIIRTGAIRIAVSKVSGSWEVRTADEKIRIYPSDGPVYGMFRDGYSLFDNASFFGEKNSNSRHSHWFLNRETGNYHEIFLEQNLISDRYFIYGPSFKEILLQFNQLTGPVPLLPKKAYGFMQTQHLGCPGTQEKLLAVAKKFRDRDIPCDILIIDFEWGDGCDGTKEVKWGSRLDWSSGYTKPLSPGQMIQKLKELHYDVLLIHHSAPDFPNRKNQGWTESVYDEDMWWQKFREKLDMGIAGTWQDTRRNDITDSVIWNHIRKYHGPGKRVLFMGCRKMQLHNPWDNYFCALPMNQVIGSRRYPLDWTGDCSFSWQELAWQIRAITNTHGSMKGISYISSDAVGADWKIQARWNQFSDFSPISRSHNPKPWSGNIDTSNFIKKIRITNRNRIQPEEAPGKPSVRNGQTAEDSIRKHRKLRYRFLPYLYSYAHRHYQTGMPVCRPMIMAFPEDHHVNGDQWPHQYLLGEWILVAPVTGDYRTMEIFFPGGTTWIDYWNKEIIQGGGILPYDVSDIGKLPLFIREGAILPKRQESGWIDPTVPDQLTFEIYPAKFSHFTLYEDDGITTGYQTGKYSTMKILCRKVPGEIQIDILPVRGTYRNRPADRPYSLEVFWPETAPRTVTLNRKRLKPQKKIPGFGEKGWHLNPEAQFITIGTGTVKTSGKQKIIISDK